MEASRNLPSWGTEKKILSVSAEREVKISTPLEKEVELTIYII
jgi:hypothetical protein